jgi:hypothetical protein
MRITGDAVPRRDKDGGMTRPPSGSSCFRALLPPHGRSSRADSGEAVMARFDSEISGTARGYFSLQSCGGALVMS